MSLVRNQVTQLSPYTVSGSTATPVAEPVTFVLESCLCLRFVFDWIRVRNPEGSSCPSAQWELAVRSEAANLNPIMYLILFLLERLTSVLATGVFGFRGMGVLAPVPMRGQHAPAALATYALLFHGRLGRVTMSPSESIRVQSSIKHTNKACAPGTR